MALYNGLFGPRFAVQSSDEFAKAIGYPRSPVDDLLVFHIVFGKTVPDVSLNAVANLGYARLLFPQPGLSRRHVDARCPRSSGLKENSSRKTGIVYVRTTGYKQDGTPVLEYVRWVMVRKRDECGARARRSRAAPADGARSEGSRRSLPADRLAGLRFALAGSAYRFDDYTVGERIDHVDGVTVEEAEHMIATRLYQNTARIHFDQYTRGTGPLRPPADLRRPRNFVGALAIVQRARQCLPRRRHQRRPSCRATVRRRNRIRVVGSAGKIRAAGAEDVGRLRLRTIASRDRPCEDFPFKSGADTIRRSCSTSITGC